MIAATPHDSVFGGFANSPPFRSSSSNVFCTSSHSNDIPVNVPIRSSSRGGQESDGRFALGRPNSIQRTRSHRLIRLKCKSEDIYIEVDRTVLIANGNTGEFHFSDHGSPLRPGESWLGMDWHHSTGETPPVKVARRHFSQLALPGYYTRHYYRTS